MPLFSVTATVFAGNRFSSLSDRSCGDGSHLADDANNVAALGFYNIGISNLELLGKKWAK